MGLGGGGDGGSNSSVALEAGLISVEFIFASDSITDDEDRLDDVGSAGLGAALEAECFGRPPGGPRSSLPGRLGLGIPFFWWLGLREVKEFDENLGGLIFPFQNASSSPESGDKALDLPFLLLNLTCWVNDNLLELK